MQLMTAYILANSTIKGTHNHLLLLHPNGYELWDRSYCLTHMSMDKSTWHKISVVKRWINRNTKISVFKTQIDEMRESVLQNGKVDNVYLGSDKIIQNQLIVELSGNTKFHRIDEGWGSYWSHDRHWASKIWQAIRIKYFRALAGLHTNMRYNLNGLGYSKAAETDYLYKSNLLERPTPHAVKIEREDIFNVMEKLTREMPIIPELDTNSILFLGSDFVERKVYSAELELNVLTKINDLSQKIGAKLIYKPHTSEEGDKLDFYQKNLPIKILRVAEPVEVIYYRHENIKSVLSYGSSGLLYADIFSRQPVKTAALMKVYGQNDHHTVVAKIMKKGGVSIPDTMEELEQLLSSNE